MKSIHHFASLMKKMIYIFHGNRNSFDMIFITIIQPKIHKHRFYFKLFSLQNIYLMGSGIPELENRVKKLSYPLLRHKTESSQIVTS